MSLSVGEVRSTRKNIDNFGLIDANVDRAGSSTNLTISGQFGGGISQGLLNNQGTLRASNGGGLLINIRETEGGIIEAVGTGSRIQVNPNRFEQVPATRMRNVTFRTSGGGLIDLRGNDRDAVFLENVTNEGFIQASHVRLFGTNRNTGSLFLLNGFDDNISLGSDVLITGDGNGVIDFLQGGRNLHGEFHVRIEDNTLRSLGTFDTLSTHLRNTVLDPENRSFASRPDIGVFEFLSESTVVESEFQFDFFGKRVAKDTNTPLGAAQENIVNTFRDTFSNSGLKSVNIEYDQLNFFETLTLDGEIKFQLEFLAGFSPEDGDFFDILTADELILGNNFRLLLDGPVIDGKTFGSEILSLPDPVAGNDREVLRLTWGVTAIPEPASSWTLVFIVFLSLQYRRKAKA